MKLQHISFFIILFLGPTCLSTSNNKKGILPKNLQRLNELLRRSSLSRKPTGGRKFSNLGLPEFCGYASRCQSERRASQLPIGMQSSLSIISTEENQSKRGSIVSTSDRDIPGQTQMLEDNTSFFEKMEKIKTDIINDNKHFADSINSRSTDNSYPEPSAFENNSYNRIPIINESEPIAIDNNMWEMQKDLFNSILNNLDENHGKIEENYNYSVYIGNYLNNLEGAMCTIDKRIETLEERLNAQIFWNWVGFAIIIVGSIILLGTMFMFFMERKKKSRKEPRYTTHEPALNKGSPQSTPK